MCSSKRVISAFKLLMLAGRINMTAGTTVKPNEAYPSRLIVWILNPLVVSRTQWVEKSNIELASRLRIRLRGSIFKKQIHCCPLGDDQRVQHSNNQFIIADKKISGLTFLEEKYCLFLTVYRTPCGQRPGGTLQCFIRGDSATRSNLWSFFNTILTKKVPLSYTFNWQKSTPFIYIYYITGLHHKKIAQKQALFSFSWSAW